ncbi:MAG: Fpg/Nei family DNA glycosylase [Vulcanimicrobiota bacterium]
MPELPDVENMKKFAQENALDKTIETVKIRGEGVFQVSESTLRRHLLHNKLKEASRYGKYLFLEISDGYYLVLHFGMTGNFHYSKEGFPEHSKFILELEDGGNFAYINIRKLGKVDITDDKDSYIKEQGLGPDAQAVSMEEFKKILQNKRGSIKNALMNQHTLAGLGNVYADEILFHTEIKPQHKISDLNEEHLEEIFKSMNDVIKTALKHNADPNSLPSDYLLGGREERECPICGGDIKKTRFGGRPTLYCTQHQK